MSKMFQQLLDIIESDEFKNKLNELNDNFFNLKQEIHIRNLLVELFNQKHFPKAMLANDKKSVFFSFFG